MCIDLSGLVSYDTITWQERIENAAYLAVTLPVDTRYVFILGIVVALIGLALFIFHR
jgi:hypothetical protein